jgi:hypothetical protein
MWNSWRERVNTCPAFISANIAHAVLTICDFSPSRFVYACLEFERTCVISLANWRCIRQDSIYEKYIQHKKMLHWPCKLKRCIGYKACDYHMLSFTFFPLLQLKIIFLPCNCMPFASARIDFTFYICCLSLFQIIWL